jgi:cytochrome c biogenesis DsbD-like protein
MKTSPVKLIVILAFVTATAAAQLGTQRATRVTFAPVAPVKLKRGSSARLELTFRVAPGYHVNSNKPKSELLIPTSLHLDMPTDLSLSKIDYPDGEDKTFPFSPDEKLNVYTGDVSVSGMLNAGKAVIPGSYRVHGYLKYQACDDRACYPPAQVPIAFDVQVLKAPKPGHKNPAQSPHVHS